jgi:hypothetical protein
VALSEAAGPRARDALLGQLEGGDEVDRAAVLTALGGVLARVPNEVAVAKLAEALSLAAGPERDGAVEALGRAPLPSAVKALVEVSHSEEAADRRVAAVMASAHPDAPAVALLRVLLGDADASVRAQAAWSLGSIGDESDAPRLLVTARQGDPDAATNAAAALGRIAGRRRNTTSPASPSLSAALCGLLTDTRPYVRANALVGLATGGIRCGGGQSERVLLAEDPNEDVRAAAAAALATAPTPDDGRALERCARSDPSGFVAMRCRNPCLDHAAAQPQTCRPHPTHVHAALIYVVPEGASTPRPGAAYAMLLADGTIRAGTTDRRGAAFDPVAPEGTVRLRPASALAR